MIALLLAASLAAPDKPADYMVVECDSSTCWVNAPSATPSDQQIATIYKENGAWVITPGVNPPAMEEPKDAQPEEQKKPDGDCGSDTCSVPDSQADADPQAEITIECLRLDHDTTKVVNCKTGEVLEEVHGVRLKQ